MDCTEARNKMQAVIDREISAESESHEVKSHCQDCSCCRREFDNLDYLHNRMKEFSGNIKTPEGMQARLRERLQREATVPGADGASGKVVSIFGSSRNLALAGAAAAAIVALWAVPFFRPDAAPHVARVPVQTEQPTAIAAAPARASDIVAHFGEGLTAPDNKNFDIKAIASAAGFPVVLPALSGFKVSHGEVCDVAGRRFVRLTYGGSLGGKEGTLVCYVCPTGAFNAAGLDTHVIGGRKVCCGQMQQLSLVYLPAKTKGTDWVLVAHSTKSDLMDVALKS